MWNQAAGVIGRKDQVGVYEVVREEVEYTYASTSISKVKLTKFARPDSKERGVWKMDGGVWKTKIL